MMTHRPQYSDQKLLNPTDPPDKYTREHVLRTLQAILTPQMLVPPRESHYLASETLKKAPDKITLSRHQNYHPINILIID